MSNMHLIYFFLILCEICTELCSSILEDVVNLHLLLQTRKHSSLETNDVVIFFLRQE